MSAFRKVHLMRSTRTTWCGRRWVLFRTRNIAKADCAVCLAADAAEAARNKS